MSGRYSVNLNVHEIDGRTNAEEIHRALSEMAIAFTLDFGADASVVVTEWPEKESEK